MRCNFGKCPRTAEDGRKVCAHHGEMRRASKVRWQARQLSHGLCVSCSQPAEPRMRMCPRHRTAHAREARRAHAAKVARVYGADYPTLLTAQGGLCAICGQPETALGSGGRVKRLAVDHNHETGEVRGLLCNNCNRAIGLLRDDATVLRRAAEYLVGS